ARMALEMRFRDNSSRDAIAAALEITDHGAKNLMQRAKHQLRECIQKKMKRPDTDLTPDRDSPLLDACLDEVLAGRSPPDLTARIVQAHAAGHRVDLSVLPAALPG